MYAAVNYRINPEISVPNILWHTGKFIAAVVAMLATVAKFVTLAVTENAGLTAKLVGIVAVTLFLVTQPQITIAMALIVAFGWLTWR